MGARRLQPVITRRTQASRVNLARLAANAREAAEQCGVIWLPEVSPERRLDEVLAAWPAERLLIFCDEDAPVANPAAALAAEEASAGVSLLIGPEGGFERERAAGDRAAAARAAPEPRSARAARRHGRSGGAGADPEPLRRLAMTLWKGARRAFMPPRYRRSLPASIRVGRDEFADAAYDIGRDASPSPRALRRRTRAPATPPRRSRPRTRAAVPMAKAFSASPVRTPAFASAATSTRERISPRRAADAHAPLLAPAILGRSSARPLRSTRVSTRRRVRPASISRSDARVSRPDRPAPPAGPPSAAQTMLGLSPMVGPDRQIEQRRPGRDADQTRNRAAGSRGCAGARRCVGGASPSGRGSPSSSGRWRASR